MERTIQITGKGKVPVSPDILVLSFDVEARAWEYEATITELNRKVESLRRQIEAVNLDRKNLKTKDFDIEQSTLWNKKLEKSEFNGYRASHDLEIEVPLDRQLINQLLTVIVSGNESIDFKIAFGVKDAAAVQQRVLLKAIAKAKENAELLTGATGVVLKEILTIDYSFREIIVRSQRHHYPIYEAAVMMESAAPAMDFEPDDIDVSETVTIVWRIE